MSKIEAAPSTGVGEVTEKNDVVTTDIELQKTPLVPIEASGGAGKMEAITAVFGERGKLIIIGAYVLVRSPAVSSHGVWCWHKGKQN